MNDSKLTYLAGVVGSDPEVKETRIGDLVNFRLGVTVGYPKDGAQYGQTDWYDVVVKHPGLQQAVMNEVYKGAKVMAQGNAQQKVGRDGRDEFSIWADRIALLEYLRRDQAPEPAAVATSDDELGF